VPVLFLRSIRASQINACLVNHCLRTIVRHANDPIAAKRFPLALVSAQA
jgi:hypothetical protein